MSNVDLTTECRRLAERAKSASRHLAVANAGKKNQFLQSVAEKLSEQSDHILAANGQDIDAAPAFGMNAAQIDRLRLTHDRIQSLAKSVQQIKQLPEPVGRVLDSTTRPNGLRIDRITVPLGVIFFLYESRPNVTIDAAALAIKSGNAIILRGGKEARHTNSALYRIIVDSLSKAGLPTDAVQMVPTTDRDAVGHLLKLSQYIDLVIPRGGESLIERVTREATMPMMKHFRGNCHVYVDASADLEMAKKIIVNAKCQRPGVCNAAETLLVHTDVAEPFLTDVAKALFKKGVELRGCEQSCRFIPKAIHATDDDYAAEFLDLILAVKVVDSLDQAIAHIHQFGSGHTEAIVTNDLESARCFTTGVDAAAVMVNASTRFHDGFEFGLGAEIGISTDKFHARGPCGLRELTSYKYVVYGTGQTRE